MAPETGTALLVLVAFVLPGFVALLIGERTRISRPRAISSWAIRRQRAS